MNKKTYKSTIVALLAVFIGILPLWFIPFVVDFYALPKSILALVIASIILVVFLLAAVNKKSLVIVVKPLHLPLLAVGCSFLLSLLFQSPNPADAWATKGVALFSMLVIYLISSNVLRKGDLEIIKWSLVISTTILSLLSIYQLLGITKSMSENLSWLNNKLWTPTGSPTSMILVVLTGIIVSLTTAIRNQRSVVKTGVLLFTVLVQGIAVAAVISELLPGKDSSIVHLPYAYGYSIAIDSLKNWKTALLGVGPDNFISAFTRFKPLGFNNLENLWNVKFATSSNEIFHVMTTTGLLGLLAWIWLGVAIIKTAIKKWKSYPEWTLTSIILVLYLLLLPANITALAWLLVIIIVLGGLSDAQKEIKIKQSGVAMVVGFSALLIISSYYYSFKYISADYYFRNALNAVSSKKDLDVYNMQIRAINTNEHNINYRITYSRTNLAVATNLASKKDLTEEDTQWIVTLIQQSVREARAAVQLNPQNVTAWENLANTYKELINFANNAQDFAINSYNQALKLDPRNPKLWVDYGGLLMSVGQIDGATQAFRQAVALKPDYANAHFNLANAFRADNKLVQAYQEMQRVQKLVDPNTQDYLTATAQVDELKKMIEDQIKSPDSSGIDSSEQIQEPTLTVPSPAIKKPDNIDLIELPEYISPPDDLALPTPTNTQSDNSNIEENNDE